MLWAVLLPPPNDNTMSSCNKASLSGLANWALQFTPRVAVVEDALAMELESSVSLFGGRRALHERLSTESAELGVQSMAWAPNSLAGLACARAGVLNGVRQALNDVLDPLPLHVLSAVMPHHLTLAQLGCRTLGDIRRLPRAGISRRFDKMLLHALDQAYGLRPETHQWLTPPDGFCERLELPFHAETAPALLHGARRLLMQLCGWLAARQAGITALTLYWRHEGMNLRPSRKPLRPQQSPQSTSPPQVAHDGKLTIRTAQPMRDVEHLCRLLSEHLAHVKLHEPVAELSLESTDIVALTPQSYTLLPEQKNESESLTLVLERIAARLGPERVLQGMLCDDHRLEWRQHWQTLQPCAKPASSHCDIPQDMPQPTFILPEPQRLIERNNRPVYQGPLRLLAGPHRIEFGWWHRCDDDATSHSVARDYWVALSQQAGVFWIYQERLAGDATAWYLHGVFA